MQSLEELEAAQKTIELAADKGHLPPELLYQCYVTLATNYLLDFQEDEKALILLNKIPEDYFKETIIYQMDHDDLFARATLKLAYRLIQLGYTLMDFDQPTQAKGDA